ncbi:hypothetical protein [Paenibacillus sp. RC84]
MIDILIIVKDITKVDDNNEQMILIGYKPRGGTRKCWSPIFFKRWRP